MEVPKVIVLEEGADLDALSSALAVQKLYPDSVLLKPRYLSRKAGKVFKEFRHLFRLTEELPKKFLLVLVDTRNVPEGIERERIEGFIVYDHHPSGEVEEFSGKVERVGSSTTLVVEELMKKSADLTPEEATLILLGIYEDTGSFTYEGTTPRDLTAASWLLSKGASLRKLREHLSGSYTREQIEALREIVSSVEKLYIGKKNIAVATAVLERYEPDLISLLYEMKDLKEADAFFVIIEAEGKTYVFGRSQDPEIDAGRILSKLGGGGHPEAGALKLENVPASRLKSLILNLLRSEGPLKVRVGEIMTSPPFVLRSDMSLREALSEMTERGFGSAPVVDEEGRLVGIISKKDLLKLSKFLPDERVGSFALREVRTLKPEDLIWEAEEILSRFGQNLIPVVEGEKVVGVLTRVDLLRRLREDLGDLEARRKRIRIPENIEGLAKEVGEISASLGFRAYMVGGAVRDLLLGREVLDVDFTIEGYALKVGEELAKKHKVPLHPFPEFGTAHLKVGNVKVELSTARRETYSAPGSYPKVERASIKEDLLRRDFTINALAISVNPEDFGTLIDYFGGLKDLKEGVIRVLHPVSFVEDPVRILRAIRFAGRFGFRLSKSTEKLLRQAVDLGLLKKAPKGRVMNELKATLKEERLPDILRLYKSFGILESLVEGFRWRGELEDKLSSLSKVIHWHSLQFPSERIDYGWVFLMVLLRDVKEEEALKLLEEASAPRWVRENTKRVFRDLSKIAKSLRSSKRNSEIYRTLRGLHTSLLLILMTEEDLTDKVKIYLEKLRYVKVPEEKIRKLKERGLSGKRLGEEVEKLRDEIMDSLI